ncbi:hypothetical protein AB8880_02015 [Alphaproteobacteria bacterium LSUCC0684]
MTSSQSKTLCRGRQNLLQAIASHPQAWNLKQLSLSLGRNHAYLQQYVHRGSPKTLPEQIRYQLADLLRIDETKLRSTLPFPGTKNGHKIRYDDMGSDLITIGYVDHPSQLRIETKPWSIPVSVFRRNSTSSSEKVRLAVLDESTPDHSFRQGDVVILDTADTSPLRSGYFAIDAGQHIRVRYIEQNTNGLTALLHIGQNEHARYEISPPDINIMGRVIFHSRAMEM